MPNKTRARGPKAIAALVDIEAGKKGFILTVKRDIKPGEVELINSAFARSNSIPVEFRFACGVTLSTVLQMDFPFKNLVIYDAVQALCEQTKNDSKIQGAETSIRNLDAFYSKAQIGEQLSKSYASTVRFCIA